MARNEPEFTVELGEHEAVIRKLGNRRSVRIARILGSERRGGSTWYWLDRLVFPPGPRNLQAGWSAHGAISTVLVHRE